MNRLFILGAGGFGRELLSWLKHCPEWDKQWKFSGFLDDGLPSQLSVSAGAYIVGTIKDFQPHPGDHLACGIGDPRTRLKICRDLAARDGLFPIIRHPSSVVGLDSTIGEGCILCPGVVITANVSLGRFVLANVCSTVGHDAKIGDGVTLSPHADVTGLAEVGEGTFLGSHASVLPGAKVGSYARVGAGSVVLRSVKSGATVFGVPAKQIS